MTTEQNTTHTPTPWRWILHGNEAYPYALSIEDESGQTWIARDGTVSSLANAEYIVRCVNTHADLLAMCKRLTDAYEECGYAGTELDEEALALIAKVESTTT